MLPSISLKCAVALLCATGLQGFSQGFVNLDFENATIVPIPNDPYGRVSWSAAVPARSIAATNEPPAHPASQDWAGSTVSQAGTRGRTQELKPGGAEAWGLPKEGFLLGIRMDKDEFTNGEPVTATITLRNVSHKELKHWESRSGDQMTRFLLSKDGEKIKGYFDPMDNTFAERLKSARAGSKTTCADPVGTERVFSHEISKLYPLTNGTYRIRAKRSDLINEELTDTLSIESGDYTFKILGSSEQRDYVPK